MRLVGLFAFNMKLPRQDKYKSYKKRRNENTTPRRLAMNYSTRGTCNALQRNQTNKTTKVTIIATESGYSPVNIRQSVQIFVSGIWFFFFFFYIFLKTLLKITDLIVTVRTVVFRGSLVKGNRVTKNNS